MTTQYRDDHWLLSPFNPLDPEAEGGPAASPHDPVADAAAPDAPGFPEGGGAGGGFDDRAYPEEPDFDDGLYYDPDAADEDDGYRIIQTEDPCARARHALAEALEQIETDVRAIEREREVVAEARERLRECGSDTTMYLVPGWGGDRYISCDAFYSRRIRIFERDIARRQDRQRRLQSQLPALKRRVQEACAGAGRP